MNQSQTQVSIIMPVKNAGSYLHDCLSSIRRQTFLFWELVVVNDHSSDDTTDILARHQAEDARIRSYNNEGKGIIPALQLALSKTKGRFITRMDGDDLMPENKLALMVNTLSKAGPGSIATGKVRYFSDQPVSQGYLSYENWLNERIDQQDHWDWVYRECVIASPNWMIRKDDLTAAGGFDQLSYPEDYHLVLNWYQHGLKLLSLPDLTLLWREHPERTSRNSDHYNQEHFFRLKVKHFITHQLGESTLVLWGAGTKGRLTASILDELEIPFHWMDLEPEKYPDGINSQPIGTFRDIEKLSGFRLLISVFPPTGERKKLESYLQSLNLQMGHHYWYL